MSLLPLLLLLLYIGKCCALTVCHYPHCSSWQYQLCNCQGYQTHEWHVAIGAQHQEEGGAAQLLAELYLSVDVHVRTLLAMEDMTAT
jgi:hypothetical protein